MKRKVKIVLHHQINQSFDAGKKIVSWPSLKSVGYGLLNALLAVSYAVGWLLLSIFKLPGSLLAYLRIDRQGQWGSSSLKRAAGFIILILVALAPLLALKVASEGQRIGGRILGISDSVLGNINSAQEAIKQEDYELAQNNFASALTDLKTAQSELDQSSIFLRSVVNFAPASYNTGNILEAAELLAQAAQKGSGLMAKLKQLRFSPEGLTVSGSDQQPRQALLHIRTEISDIHSNLGRANQLLAPLDSGALPASYQTALQDSQSLVADLSRQMSSLSAAADLFIELLLGEKRFLVFLQNNNELRATGGFIGTIAQGTLRDASVQRLDIRSVYDLDGQLRPWITPPFPLRAVNHRWFMRDANWLASFPDAGKRLSVMYEMEGGETPDLILGITPDLFIDLLNATGPISLPAYRVTISSSNFVEQIQTTTSVAYDKNLNQPKQLLADLYPLLLQKIGEGDKQKLGVLGLLEIIQKHLTEKNILVFSRDQRLQQTLSTFRWTGEMVSSSKDYLQINSSNLGGSKTDRAIVRKAHVTTTLQPDGSIINQVQYTVTNLLPNTPGLKNRSFVRFYVPTESRLLAAGGFDSVKMPELPDGQRYANDPVIEQWNHDLQFDAGHNLFQGKESGKTFFANWVEVNGGDTKTATITYQLPFKLKNPDSYSLYWQKQPGMPAFETSQEIIAADHAVIWDNLGGQSRAVEKPNAHRWLWRQTATTRDQFVGLVLKPAK